MQLLDLNLSSERYSDLKTSVKPSYSITIDKVPRGFKKKLSDFTKDELSKLQLWIQIVWTDEEEEEQELKYFSLKRMEEAFPFQVVNPKDRGKETINRFEMALQNRMWRAVSS